MLLPQLDDWLFCAAWKKLHACGGDFTEICNLQRRESKETGEVNSQLFIVVVQFKVPVAVSQREGEGASYLLSYMNNRHQNFYLFSLTSEPLDTDIENI